MAEVNTVDISEFQDPKEVDYQAMKDAGIKNLIIRGSVDLRLDHHAAEHIANAKKYGFNWHLYHYFYNDTNEAGFAVKAAKSLGLGEDQILFLDMEDKSLPKNWNEQFSIFRKAVGNSFKVGLYCSDSPYNAKFSDNQLKQLGVIRWIASYSYEPKNYDVWQKSGAGSGGFGTYTKDIDRDVDPNNILAISSSKPYVPTSEDKMVRQIILQAGYDTETGIYGLGCSFDNGATFKVYWTIYGPKFYQEDADRLWPLLIDKVKSVMSIDWDSIKNKPKFVTPDELEARLDKLSVPTVKWADIEDKPPIPSIDGLVKETELADYAKKSEMPNVNGLAKQSDLDNVKATADSATSKAEQAQSTADANTKALQNIYTKEEADRKYWTAEQEQNASNVKSVNNIEPDDQGNVNIDLTGYAKLNDIPKTMDWSQIIGKPNVATKVSYEPIYPTLINGTTGSVNAFLITLSEKVKMLSFWANVTLPTIPAWSQVDIMSFPEMHEQNHITLNQAVVPDNYHSFWSDYTSTNFSLRNQTSETVSNYSFNFFSSGIFLY